MQKKVLKLKKTLEPLEVPLEAPVAIAPEEKPKKLLRLKGLPVPPVPTGPLSQAMEAFECMREYYESRNEPIPQSDIKWFNQELEQEKKEIEAFWADCLVTKTYLDAVYGGATDDEIDIAVAKAQINQKEEDAKKPVKETDLGPMPSYGTQEFWAWCNKRKKIRLQKEAEIIAAGGTVPEKPKKPRKPKIPDSSTV
jgi:hypothetical protein